MLDQTEAMDWTLTQLQKEATFPDSASAILPVLAGFLKGGAPAESFRGVALAAALNLEARHNVVLLRAEAREKRNRELGY